MPRLTTNAGAKMPRRAYSYSRISQERTGSNSVDRQEGFAARVCAEEGWTLDDTLVFMDKNRSGFHGRNLEATAGLRRLLNLIEDRTIPAGSVLIIEALDRLSRQEVDIAYDLFRAILKAGVAIATQEPRRVYEPGPQDFVSLVEPLWLMYLNNAESRKKSLRITAEWETARAAAVASKRRTMQRGPAWLRWEGGTWQPIPERVAIVQRIVRELAGRLGGARLASALQSEGVPTFTGRGRWRASTLHEIVANRAILGEYRPTRMVGGKGVPTGDVVPDFYPPIVTEAQWDAVQVAVQLRRRRTGRPASAGAVNVLRGLAFVAATGRSLCLQVVRQGRWGRMYLFEGDLAGGLRVHYEPIVETLLATVRALRPCDVLPPDAARDEREQRMAALGERIAALSLRRADLTRKLADPDEDLESLEQARGAVKAALDAAVAERDALAVETRSGRAEALGATQSLASVRAGTDGDARKELDARIAAVLPRVVRRIEVAAERHGLRQQTVHLTIHLHNGPSRQVTIPAPGK